jgi:hypothetical protein
LGTPPKREGFYFPKWLLLLPVSFKKYYSKRDYKTNLLKFIHTYLVSLSNTFIPLLFLEKKSKKPSIPKIHPLATWPSYFFKAHHPLSPFHGGFGFIREKIIKKLCFEN